VLDRSICLAEGRGSGGRYLGHTKYLLQGIVVEIMISVSFMPGIDVIIDPRVYGAVY
jgi:hypothetical protein